MDRFSKQERSILMSKIKTQGTDIERHLLRCVKPFWKEQRYIKNSKRLPGRPDVVFVKSKVAIFADGDFWHGRDFKKWKGKVTDFWKNKITTNIERDKQQTKLLQKSGYKVLRFWGSDIKKSPDKISAVIAKAIKSK